MSNFFFTAGPYHVLLNKCQQKRIKSSQPLESPGGQMTGIPCCHRCGLGSGPGQETKILQVTECDQERKKKRWLTFED